MRSKDWKIYLVVWSLLFVAYFLIRSTTMIVWDDTTAITSNPIQDRIIISWEDPDVILKSLAYSFENLSGGGYRPLSTFIQSLGTLHFRSSNPNAYVWYVFNGFILGILGVIFFSISKIILRSNSYALISLFLFITSPPLLQSLWITFAGIQAIVPIIFGTGLILYWDITIRNSKKSLFTLCLVLLIGPYFREFTGLLPILLVFLDILKNKKPGYITYIAIVGFVHALYPTFIVKIIAYPELPLVSIFEMGHFGEQVKIIDVSNILSSISFQAPLNLFSLSPTLFILSIFILIQKSFVHKEITQNDLFLGFWFLLTFLPFLKVYTEQVHLIYCLMPLSILIASALGWAYKAEILPRTLIIILLIPLLLDQSTNVYGTYKVVNSCNEGIIKMANWFTENTPKNSRIISNALHAEDIRLFSKKHIKVNWTVKAGVPRPDESLINADDYRQFLKNNTENVYLLAMDFNYEDHKRGYHSHRFIKYDELYKKDYGNVYVVRARYPYVDPLKYFMPRKYMSFLGPPDLENDYYRGPSQDGAVFLREVFVRYRVIEVSSQGQQ